MAVEAQGIPGVQAIEVRADTFGLPLGGHALAAAYDKPSVLLEKGAQIRFTVEIPETGPYILSFDLAATESFINPPEAQLLIDGGFPTEDTRRIVFPIFYQNTGDEFPLDRYGNEALIRQERLLRWAKASLRDANYSLAYPVQVMLTAGLHDFELTLTEEAMLLGSIYIEPFVEYPAYDAYLQTHPAADASGFLLELEAEHPSYKNDTSIRPIGVRSLEVTPYDTYKLRKKMLLQLNGYFWNYVYISGGYGKLVPKTRRLKPKGW